MNPRCLAATVALCAVAASGRAQEPAELRFARVFGDNMVLQEKKKARVWGWAGRGARVTVTITEDEALARPYLSEEAGPAGDGYSVTVKYVERNAPAFVAQTRTAEADGNGAWRVEFDPMPAGFTPKYIVARAGGKGIAIRNALIGEIWVCAGQSNMGWGNFNRKDREAASADFPGLRYIAWNDSWYRPLDDVRKEIAWRECSPEAAKRFSAVPYLFGLFLHRYLKTPVGVINVARGGTTGQTWCLREELDGIDNVIIKTVLRDYDEQTAVWDDPAQVRRIMADWEKACELKKAEHEKSVARAKAEGKKEPRLGLPRKPGD